MEKNILVIGALGQVGVELTAKLREIYGCGRVVAADIKFDPAGEICRSGPFEALDCMIAKDVNGLVHRHKIGAIYHLAAMLSAAAEAKPQRAWRLNMGGLVNILDAAREYGCAVFTPSSIGAFGPLTPPKNTPQDTIQRPGTMYGITKVSGEMLCDYYFSRFGVDTRGIRYPGLISSTAMPGGGTTDYAVEIFHEALKNGKYECYLKKGTCLDMMYMPDAIRAAIGLMEADAAKLKHRNAFNLTAMSLTPKKLAQAIRKHIPDFEITYRIDPVRQAIADSWPDKLDDSAARAEWRWKPEWDLKKMTVDMLTKLFAKQDEKRGKGERECTTNG